MTKEEFLQIAEESYDSCLKEYGDVSGGFVYAQSKEHSAVSMALGEMSPRILEKSVYSTNKNPLKFEVR